jgi:hypothetical protein
MLALAVDSANRPYLFSLHLRMGIAHVISWGVLREQFHWCKSAILANVDLLISPTLLRCQPSSSSKTPDSLRGMELFHYKKVDKKYFVL